jgi:hypothetical protein
MAKSMSHRRGNSREFRPREITKILIAVQINTPPNFDWNMLTSVGDPLHFDANPDPRLRPSH